MMTLEQYIAQRQEELTRMKNDLAEYQDLPEDMPEVDWREQEESWVSQL